jgi:hypothetical protein
MDLQQDHQMKLFLFKTAFPPADRTLSKQEFSVRKGRPRLEPSRKPQRHIAHVAMD